ncbi:FBD-associated F-box protein At1g66310-like [Syzygium oleosum]|uniref:FBD-associated F-box protein At1g66310-like n=1 Tax=Syzygium oleosum TaxID=219896 RepID=UPI0011D2B0FD|nr:FBD-associated F-box protein At1g66310-like [Syzygium oleosum]
MESQHRCGGNKDGRSAEMVAVMALKDVEEDIVIKKRNNMKKNLESLVPCKNVVRTSTLSERWEYLSRNNQRLDISESNFPEKTHFVNFVDRALSLHDFPLKMFSLFCKTVFVRSRIDGWITASIKRKVKELRVGLVGGMLEYVLPSCVFNCETLIELHLSMSHELRLPSLVYLKNLKVLTLVLVDFGGDSSVEKFLPCPFLEELVFNYCRWRRLKVLHISTPKHLGLQIVEQPLYEDLENTFCLGVNGARIKFVAYIGPLINYYTISSSSSLVRARINLDMFGWPHHHHFAYHEYKLLKDLSSAITGVDPSGYPSYLGREPTSLGG